MSLALAAVFLLATCARDVTGDVDAEPEPVLVRLGMRTQGNFEPDTWYYFVVNFSKYPTTTADTAPLPSISSEDRGRNWELYIMYHRDETLGEQLVTLQRPRVPTQIGTGLEPVDAVAGNFTPGDSTPAEIDVMVACRGADRVQLVKGRELQLIDNLFFDEALSLDPLNGPAPYRLHSLDLDGDSDLDLAVIYQGREGAGGPAIRFFLSDGNGTFALQSEIALPEEPTDSLLTDINPDTNTAPELLVLTRNASGNGTLRIFNNDGAALNGFTTGATVPVGLNPVQLSAGNLDADNLDLAVANRGPDGGNGSISVLLGGGDGTFTAGPVLAAVGNVTGVGIARFFGTGNDVSYTTLDGTVGRTNVYLKETAEDFQADPISKDLGDRPQSMIAFDSNNDSRAETYIVNGIPGSGNSALLIERGTAVTQTGSSGTSFGWNEIQIAYPVGREPSRIIPSILDGNGVQDLIITNSGSGTNGDSISLYYGLGKHNYTNADVFWTDETPQLLTTQPWYLSHSIGPNSIELEIDPRLFFDLTNEVPEGFLFDWMTGTTDIQLTDNLLEDGEIREHFSSPGAVPFRVDVIDNEQTNPRVPIGDTAPQQDIIDWYVETS
ncbi:hypothetical protein IT575_15415 [bacterium]|nr:hypothetical protein [bacterium]